MLTLIIRVKIVPTIIVVGGLAAGTYIYLKTRKKEIPHV
jgi:hypothetical protein